MSSRGLERECSCSTRPREPKTPGQSRGPWDRGSQEIRRAPPPPLNQAEPCGALPQLSCWAAQRPPVRASLFFSVRLL